MISISKEELLARKKMWSCISKTIYYFMYVIVLIALTAVCIFFTRLVKTININWLVWFMLVDILIYLASRRMKLKVDKKLKEAFQKLH